MSTAKPLSGGTSKDARTLLARVVKLDSGQAGDAYSLLCDYVAHRCTKYIVDLQLSGQEKKLVFGLQEAILEYQIKAEKGGSDG